MLLLWLLLASFSIICSWTCSRCCQLFYPLPALCFCYISATNSLSFIQGQWKLCRDCCNIHYALCAYSTTVILKLFLFFPVSNNIVSSFPPLRATLPKILLFYTRGLEMAVPIWILNLQINYYKFLYYTQNMPKLPPSG